MTILIGEYKSIKKKTFVILFDSLSTTFCYYSVFGENFNVDIIKPDYCLFIEMFSVSSINEHMINDNFFNV
jgi:hypothetical protein